jgi:eukaryotic-like serine/threonine-protein kinase
MADQQITQTVFGDHNIFTGIGDINVVYQLPPVEAEDRRNLLILLRKVKQFWIEGVLEQSVYHEAMIQLGKETRPEMVQHPWEKVLELPDKTSRSLPPDKNIREVFKEAGRALLILGEPGSGKTITLLELAQELISIAENDPTQPIPIVLNLSTWSIQNPSIFDWLVGELSSKYQIPKRFGRPWVGNNRLLLLLDGLDEVDHNQRDRCVKAINEFVEQSGVPGIAVCSRLEEYLALPVYLKLSGAICLQPLTFDQINEYFDKVGSPLAALGALLPNDLILQELAQTPLMLNVMSLAYQDLPIEALSQGEFITVEGRRKNLFDTYIKRMFERKGKADSLYDSNRVIEWLTWLAKRMILHSETIFLMEELQPSWLRTRKQFWVYGLISRLFFGLIIGLAYELISGLISGRITTLIFWLISGLSAGLIIGLFNGLLFILTNESERKTSYAQTVEASIWHWLGTLRRTKLEPNFGLIYGLSYGLSVGIIIGIIVGLNVGWFEGMFVGLIGGWIFGIISGLTNRKESITSDIQTIEALNWSWEGVGDGCTYGMFGGMIVGSIFGFIGGTIFYLSMVFEQGTWGTGMDMILGMIMMIMLPHATGILCGAIGMIIGSIFGGLKSIIIEKKSLPNQGILWSIRNAVFGGLLGGLICGLSVWIILVKMEMLIDGTIFGLSIGILAGLLFYGGLDVIKHYTLRLILWWQGYTPLNYVRFLDYATKLIFLRKVGGGYIFIHRMLLEHFAAMGKEESGKEVT